MPNIVNGQRYRELVEKRRELRGLVSRDHPSDSGYILNRLILKLSMKGLLALERVIQGFYSR